MFAETKPGWFRITVWVALASTSTRRCWSSGRTVKTLMRVTTSFSFEIVTIRYLPPLASCAVPPLKDNLCLEHELPTHLKPACKISLLREFGGANFVLDGNHRVSVAPYHGIE